MCVCVCVCVCVFLHVRTSGQPEDGVFSLNELAAHSVLTQISKWCAFTPTFTHTHTHTGSNYTVNWTSPSFLGIINVFLLFSVQVGRNNEFWWNREWVEHNNDHEPDSAHKTLLMRHSIYKKKYTPDTPPDTHMWLIMSGLNLQPWFNLAFPPHPAKKCVCGLILAEPPRLSVSAKRC